MYLFFADEADQDKTDDGTFLIYGGAIFKSSKVHEISLAIDGIREKYSFEPEHSLKFSPHDKPKNLSTLDFIAAKKEVFAAAAAHEVLFIGYAFNNNCANAEDSYRTKLYWGADQILAKFNAFLRQKNDYGIAFFDRMPLKQHRDYLKDKFSHRNNDVAEFKQTNRILSYANYYDRISHLASIADILVGSFRMIVNEPHKDKAGRELASLLKNLLVRDENVIEKKLVTNHGLLVRPISEKFEKPSIENKMFNCSRGY